MCSSVRFSGVAKGIGLLDVNTGSPCLVWAADMGGEKRLDWGWVASGLEMVSGVRGGEVWVENSFGCGAAEVDTGGGNIPPGLASLVLATGTDGREVNGVS